MTTLKAAVKSVQDTIASGGTATDEQIQSAIEAAAKVAALEKKIADLDEIKKSIEKAQTSIDDFRVSNNAVTNNFKNVSHWLGSTNKNSGAFIRPTNPRTGERYASDKDVNDYLSDVGLVAFIDAYDMERDDAPSFKYRTRLWERVLSDANGSETTNTMASFGAVYNWADGTSVVCTGGVYSVHQDYRFVTNIVWATNWTEAVKTITKNETTNIVRVVTNLVNNYETITTQVYKVEAFTNWHEMVEWTTNFTVNVISNRQEILDWTTNFVSITTAITNKRDYVSFYTNVFNHEEFVTNVISKYSTISNFQNFVNFQTNMFYHETFLTNFVTEWNNYTNWHEIVDWTTNFVNVTHDITNRQEYISFHTNAYEKLHTIYNWSYVTNYIIRYMGGGRVADPEDPAPVIDPEDDPYSPEYDEEEHPEDGDILPVKNARMISAITNAPFSRIDAYKALDFDSVNTNEDGLAQIRGFEHAKDNDIPIVFIDDAGLRIITWTQYPTNLLDITTNDIDIIKRFMKKVNENNIFNIVVTNAERFAELTNSFFSVVKPDRMLDDASVWTNGEGKVEVKGFWDAADNTYPVKRIDEETDEEWWDWYYAYEYDFTHSWLDVSYESLGTYSSANVTNVIGIAGFYDAATNTVPVKVEDEDESKYHIEWRDVSQIGALPTFVGTDGSSATPLNATNRVVFASSNLVVHVENDASGDVKINVNIRFMSGDDSNVKFTTAEVDGEPVIKVDVYYK